jgi:uroporphyrinogen decarboxylase
MTGKQALELILAGKQPPFPPHWELAFQIEKELFGIDPEPVLTKNYPSEAAKNQALWAHQVQVFERLIDELDWAAIPGGYDTGQFAFMKKALGDHALVAGYEGSGIFWMPGGNEIMDFVVRLFEQPKELHAEARRKCDAAKEQFHQLNEQGADFFVGTYDFGFNDAPFISPKHFQEFVTPYLTELVQTVHNFGKKFILHSDGCLTQILDQLHQTGIDGYQSVDPQGHMDIQQVRAQYPDLILMGNVACNMLQDTNAEKIQESVRYCMTHGGMGKPYIFSTSNCIFKGMPPESYLMMVEEYRKLIKARN